MLGARATWWRFPSLCPSKQKTTQHDTDTCEEDSTFSEDDSAATGSEWVYIEEPVGFFVPKMQQRKQHLHLDQAQHLLHYGSFKHVMRLHNISLVTSVEDTDAHGASKWWMTIQDPSTVQVWVVYFPSRHRLQAWIDLMSSVFNATNSRAVISALITIKKPPTAPPF
ncbi:hypothetical protein PHYPSEUDO_007421 [Phytophthora pseudosyringae]|uniref:Uncharacterized protein n=1 Tax=Phytophthora pseudosyringae TaxID=221518 RepID=A0A8T1WM95_9STRA|nr:hypothetical protein PHYPSEUDO_007421 [Phytophthora pseudosyringae]